MVFQLFRYEQSIYRKPNNIFLKTFHQGRICWIQFRRHLENIKKCSSMKLGCSQNRPSYYWLGLVQNCFSGDKLFSIELPVDVANIKRPNLSVLNDINEMPKGNPNVLLQRQVSHEDFSVVLCTLVKNPSLDEHFSCLLEVY